MRSEIYVLIAPRAQLLRFSLRHCRRLEFPGSMPSTGSLAAPGPGTDTLKAILRTSGASTSGAGVLGEGVLALFLFSYVLWLTVKLNLFPWDHFELLSLLR